MPVTTPKYLDAYIFHGVQFKSTEEEWVTGECPFCGRYKFHVQTSNGGYNCKGCEESSSAKDNEGGNAITRFLRRLHERSKEQLSKEVLEDLAHNRKLLEVDTLIHWGVTVSPVTGEYLLPSYDISGNLRQLYKYTLLDSKPTLLPTPGLGHFLYGMPHRSLVKDKIVICEGPWDAMALWEVMRHTKTYAGTGYAVTSNADISLITDYTVLATPSCNVFDKKWLPLFKNKEVWLLYDNDWPSLHPKTGEPQTPAALVGMRKATGLLAGAEYPAKRIKYLRWGIHSHNHDENLPHGYDVRDCLASESTLEGRVSKLKQLFGRVAPIPEEWILGRSKSTTSTGGTELQLRECKDWRTLTQAWRKALNWIPGLDGALAVMLSSVASVRMGGDQLWVKIIGPASCGKSTLCEALSCNRTFVYATSTLRGFHSGYQTDQGGMENHSLIPKIKDKTLVIKDGDTLLQSPNLPQILSEARDLYDRVSRSEFKNQMSRAWKGINCTLILCGTESLALLDQSQLGERFLDYVIMEDIEEDVEDDNTRRALYRIISNRGIEVNGAADTQQDPQMTIAMQLTAGYVQYLRENAARLLEKLEITEEVQDRCRTLAKFIAYMRSRPASKKDKSATREVSTRLAIQLMRLSLCMTVVLNKEIVDKEVLDRVTKIALDTARGDVYKMAKALYEIGEKGLGVSRLGDLINQSDEKARELLRHLRRMRAMDYYISETPHSGGRVRWILATGFRSLYQEVHNSNL